MYRTGFHHTEIKAETFTNYDGDAPGFPIYMHVWALWGYPFAPLLCDPAGLAVVWAVFCCSGAVEPLPGTIVTTRLTVWAARARKYWFSGFVERYS